MIPNAIDRTVLKLLLPVLFIFIGLNGFSQLKKVAITMDDLLTVTKAPIPAEKQRILTVKLLEAFKKHRAPVIGFVNEGKLYTNNIIDSAKINILKLWLDYGMSLGNHTKHHMNYDGHSLAEYAKDIRNGEIITSALLSQYGQKMTYFRHPYLHRGESRERADSLSGYLKQHHYIEAPVTIDNSDYIFSRAYDSLISLKDSEAMKNLGKEYIRYMESKLMFYEAQGDSLFKRPISQILLIHANSINADYLSDLLDMFEQHSYRFVTLSEALKDEAYQSEDRYYKRNGISWIHRWAITRHVSRTMFKGEPATPQYVMKLAQFEEE
jgi:peptidoglycan/xylan/chitin deacetylase (PgdA/CDA1 family)